LANKTPGTERGEVNQGNAERPRPWREWTPGREAGHLPYRADPRGRSTAGAGVTTAAKLLEALALRHADAVFVPECKDGPTQTRSHRRLDAWVLAKTWSPITTIGYEIKVDRGDWRRDDKIHDYMPLCHLLYIVAPKGIVPLEELPAGVGLLEPVGTTGRLQAKRKAARREIDLPAELMVYVLMCRTRITRENGDPTDRNWRVEQLREWVNGKDERRGLSYAVSAKIREVFEKQQSELNEQRRRNDELDGVRKRIAELGFDPSQPINAWQVRQKLDALGRVIDNNTLYEMKRMGHKLAEVADTLGRLKEGRTDGEEEVA
jgi:hypothetical protein